MISKSVKEIFRSYILLKKYVPTRPLGMQDESAGDELHLPGHRRLPPRPHLRMRRQLLRPGQFTYLAQRQRCNFILFYTEEIF